MSSYFNRILMSAAASVALVALPPEILAQQGQALPPVAMPPAAKAAPPPAKSKAAAPSTTAAPTAKGGAGGEAGLRQRVDQLEEQLIDMQVLVGTLESLAKSGGGAAPASAGAYRAAPPPSAGAYSSSDAARVDGLETQIRALTAQVERLADQVQALESGRRASAAPAAAPRGGPPSSFGTTTITSDGDQIGSLIAENAELPPPSPGQSLPPAVLGDATDPKQAYETAYGYLVQQDYGAAEAAFTEFLQRFPNDVLTANAQYWLGETYYVRRQYKQAAGAFLKGYQTYGRSAKASESLLKLAMSLDRLGQRDAACSSYAELSAKFPNAPGHVRNRAQSERQRIGCA